MNHTLSFTTKVGFNYATVVTDLNSVDCLIDQDNSLIWINDLPSVTKVFDDAGLDEDDFKTVDVPKSEYSKLVAKIAAAKEAAEKEAAMAAAAIVDDESDDNNDSE
jgi:hypothetical protein